MTAPKFTHRDRLLLAGMAMQGAVAAGDGRHGGALALDAVGRADALLAVLTETDAPACVGEDQGALDVVAMLLPYAKGQLNRLESIAHEDGLNAVGNSAVQRVTEDVQRVERFLHENGRLP